MTRFKSLIPRSKRSDNLAKIFGMGSSSQSQNVAVDEACRRDFESLDELSRLHRPENARAELQAGELDIAAQIPILDPENQDDFDHLAATGPAADSDVDEAHVSDGKWYYDDAEDDEADFSHNDYYNDAGEEDAHYDSLHKRSPALMNPSYFDAVRTSPSQGFGFGSSRYLEFSHSTNNLSLDDFQFEDDSFGEIPRQTGGFGLSSLERSPSRLVTGECLSFGVGRYYNRNDPPIQILDIPMPDPDVLEELARAPAREGKDSPFRSYYCYEPALADIDEETEPESDSGPAVPQTPMKNRHEKRSRSESIAKMLSSPFVRHSPDPEDGLASPTRRRKNSSDSLASNCSRVTSSATYRSARGGSSDSSAAGGGSLLQIDEDDKHHENAIGLRGQSSFICVKTPAPFVASNFPVAGGVPVPLPYDVLESGRHQPLSISSEERIRLLNEPSFISPGVIPQDYIRFEEPQQENYQPAAPKPTTREPETPKTEPETPQPDNSQPDNSQPEYSDSEKSQPNLSLPKKAFPVRSSSLSATPRQNATFVSPGYSHNATPHQDATCLARKSSANGAPVYVNPEAMSSYDALESKVTGVSAESAVHPSSLDPFSDLPKAAAFREPVEVGAVQQADATSSWANGVLANIHGIAATSVASPASGADAALRSATSTGAIAGTSAPTVISRTAFGTVGDLASPTLKGRVAGTNVGSVSPGRSAGKASRLPLPRSVRRFNGSYDSISEVLARDAPAGLVAGSAGVQSVIDNIIGDLASVQDNIGRIDGTVIRLSPVRQSRAVRTPTPKPKKTIPKYKLFQQGVVAPRTPNQTLATDGKLSVDKPLPSTSSISSTKDRASQGFLGLNKPLPAISPSDDFPAGSSADVSAKDVSPNFPGLASLQRTPAEKLEVARVRRFGSGVKKRLVSFWTKGDEDLAVKQASERGHRAENVNRLKALAENMDALTPKREKRHFSPFVNPVLSTVEGRDAQTVQTPTPRKRDASMNAIVAAMGLAGRRKSIGDNTRVNGA